MKLTHPCKETCSGYSQDCAEQVAALEARVKDLREMHSHVCDLLASECEERNRLRKVVDAARTISAFREEPYPSLYTSVLTSEAKTLWNAIRELDK